MASLSNINGIFDVHSTGAILFSTSHGTSGQILRSNGNAAPTWVAASTVIGGPYLPLTGGTLSGATATATGISFTVGGALTVTGNQYFNGSFIEGDGKEMFRYSDSWLRINEDNDFTSGIYCGTGVLRTDGQFEVGSTGTKFKVTSAGIVTALGNITAPSFNGLAINTTGTNNVANQIVRTGANGYVNFGWINSISGATTATITRITASNDAYLRYVTPATFRAQITDPYYAPAGTVSGVTSVATGNGLTGGTITSTGTLTMSGDYTGSLSITGANLAGTSFSDPDIVLSITDEDTTASIRNKMTGSSAITKISDATAPAPGCFQVDGSYYPQGFGPYYKISEGDEFTFEFWMRYVSGTATYNLLYAGSNFYDAAGAYLGNSQRYWGESGLNINANTGTGWYHVSGTLGPNRGSATADIPTTAEKMKLLFLFNYNPNGTIVTNYCGLKVYKSNPTVTKLYRKTLGSEASSSGRNRDLVIDSDGDIFGKDITASGTFTGSLTGNATSASTLTHNANRTDSTSYPIVWMTGSPTPAYSCAAVTITSSAGRINATTFNGALTGNASTSTTFSTGRTNYKGITDAAVIGQMMWKNYGNNHTIFDASSGTSPQGNVISNTNSINAWGATYPTLMGWNGSSTYGVRVDSARIADSATVASNYLPLAGGIMSGNIGRSAYNSGYQVGGYNNIGASHAKTNPIHAIGTSYLPTATALSNMYGIGFTRADTSFLSLAQGTGWGLYVASDGDARIFLDGSEGDIYATNRICVNSYANQAGNLLFLAGNTTTGASRSLNLRTSGSSGDPSASDDSNSTGITWGQRSDSQPYYMIYPNLENWSSSGNYSKLTLAWHTGIKIGAASGYGGTRFYNNSPDISGAAVILNVGVGNTNVGVVNALTVGGTVTWSGGGSAESNAAYDNYASKSYNDAARGHLGGYYTSGGAEKPNASIFGAGKARVAMLGSGNLGFGGPWNDVFWMSTYNGGDVKRSTAIVSSKYDNTSVWVAKQNYDSSSWGTGYLFWNSGNFTPGNYLPLAGGTMTGALVCNSTFTTNNNIIANSASYFNQDIGIGFTSGNIGGRLNIRLSAANQIAIKNNLNGHSNVTGLLSYTSASMNSGGYHLVFQAAPTSGSDTNMLLCNLNGNLRNRNNSYGQYSDETIKENITDATPKLEDVKKLKVKNFNFIGDDLKQIGLIAQETEKVFPGLVEDDLNPQGNRIKSLKYSVLVPILVKAIQELEARVKELENK